MLVSGPRSRRDKRLDTPNRITVSNTLTATSCYEMWRLQSSITFRRAASRSERW